MRVRSESCSEPVNINKGKGRADSELLAFIITEAEHEATRREKNPRQGRESFFWITAQPDRPVKKEGD